MESAITVNGKPLNYLTESEIIDELVKEAEADLTQKEQEAIDAATD